MVEIQASVQAAIKGMNGVQNQKFGHAFEQMQRSGVTIYNITKCHVDSLARIVVSCL